MKAIKAPTVEEILDLYNETKKVYSGLFSQFDEDEKFYELDFGSLLNLPDEFKNEGIILPTARDMVDACVDHTDISNARVFVNRKGTSQTSADEQEMMRKFYLGLIHRTEVESSISPWRVGAKHYWLHGVTVFKDVWDADRWVDKPEQGGNQTEEAYAEEIDEWRRANGSKMPIVIMPVHPGNVMLDPFGRESFVFETNERLCYDIRSKYPYWSNPENKINTGRVTQISFWTPQFRCELIDNEPVLRGKGVLKHNYGFIPYVFIDSGLGNLSHKADMKLRYVGILRYMKDMLVSESRDYSIADVILKKTAWPWGIITGKGSDGIDKIDAHFGTYTKLPEGVILEEKTPQVPPQALQQHLAITSEYITAHAAPNVVRGLGESGVRSAVDRRQVVAEAYTRYRYSGPAFANGTAKVLANCAYIMKNIIPGDIEVWGQTPEDELFEIKVEKDKMKEPFGCYVEFAPVSEEDEYRRHDDLERLVQTGIVTRPWARTQMSNVNPDQMALEEEIEKLRQDPAVQQALSQYLSAKMMEALTKRSATEGVNNPPPPMAQPPMGQPSMGQPPAQQGVRPMTPSLQQVNPPGSAQNLQNQMKNIRSKTPIAPMQGFGGGGNNL